MKVVRLVAGVLLLVLALPLLLGGGGLWAVMRHRSPDGSFTAAVDRVSTPGHAIVVPDLDALVRRFDVLARGGATLRITARTGTGPAFVGLGPSTNVAHYLAGVPYAHVDDVRPARGPLPVRATAVAGPARPPAAPATQAFWRHTGDPGSGTLSVSVSELRGQRLALVVMAPDAAPALAVDVTAALTPRWLGPGTWGLLVLGTVLLLSGVAVLAWPTRPSLPAPLFPAPLFLAPAAPPAPASPADSSTVEEPVVVPAAGRAPSATWPPDSPPPATPILDWPPRR